MNIAFVFQKDSHFKAVHATALRLCEQYKCEPVFIGIDTDYCPKNRKDKEIVYLQRDNLDSLAGYDYVVACLGGYLLNFVIRELAITQTKVISIFPGIVSHYQLDAFISRLNADQVWLNSKADYKLYSKICKVFRVKNNGILYGMSWLSSGLLSDGVQGIQDDRAVIFEQTSIISTHSKKAQWVYLLDKIIINNPNVLFIYKIRDNSSDKFFIELRKKLNKHDNVIVAKNLKIDDILRSKYYLSISSSALVEGLIYGKASYLLDLKMLDWDSDEFYKHSNINLKKFELKNNGYNLNEEWFKERVLSPLSHINLYKVNKKNKHLRDIKRPRVFLKMRLVQLAILDISVAKIFFNSSRVKAIKKSLEYLSS